MYMVCRIPACNASEDHGIGYGIAAQAVPRMDAAADLTGCIQAGDLLAGFRQDLRFRVDPPPMVWCSAGDMGAMTKGEFSILPRNA